LRVASFVVFFSLGLSVIAQKQVKKTVLESDISLVQIDASNCFQVFLDTGNTHEITVEAQIDGEYSKDLELEIYRKGNTLMVATGFRSSYVRLNDKLSAHKVVSIALRILLPKWKNVQVFGTNSRVMAAGEYTNLNITLADGSCELEEVSQNVKVKTQSGSILVKAKSGQFDVFNKYGIVRRDSIPKGDDQYGLSSVTGTIELRKTE